MANNVRGGKGVKKMLNTDLNNISKRLRSDFLKEATTLLLKNTKSELYDAFDEGRYYERTYDVLDSITRTQKSRPKSYSGKVYFDTKKIKPRTTRKGMYNQHKDFLGNNKASKVVVWLEDGHYVPMGKKLSYFREGAKMIEKTYEEIDNQNIISKSINKNSKGVKFNIKKKFI